MQVNLPHSPVLFINFNQDYSCLSVGTRTGYRVYNCDGNLGKCYSKVQGAIGICEMLFSTSLVAIVGAGEEAMLSPRLLQIVNTKRESTICELTFVSGILAVKLNRKRLVVVLEEHIYIYDTSNMKLLHTIDTNPNPNALCALSSSSENCYLAYPSNSSGSAGELLLFDATHLQPIHILQAHKSLLSFMAFNYDGSMIATASDKGTVIRVFSVPLGQKIFQFRRGSYPTRIFSISFNITNTLLAVSSESDTIHIFKLSNSESIQESFQPESKKQSMIESIRTPIISAAGAVGNYLPEMITEMWEPSRDFAFAKLPPTSKGLQNICALSSNELMVVTADGYFYQYKVSLKQGGEASLMKQYALIENEPDNDISSSPILLSPTL